MEEERNLLDYAYVLIKWRRLIVASVLGVSLATAGITLVLPEKWKASTTLLPPEEEIDQFGLSMLLAATVPGNLGRLMGSSTPAERLITILESKKILGGIVDRFDLMAEYGSTNRDLAIEMLDENVERELGRDGTLAVEVEASSPPLAADLANALAAELDVVNREHRSQQARLLRQFLEERMEVVQEEFRQSSQALQRFQEVYGLVDLETQTAAAVEVVQNIVQELTLLDAKLGVVRQQLKADHEERRLLELEAAEIRRQLQLLIGDLEVRTGEEVQATLRALAPPLKELPELGLEYAQLALDVKIKEGMVGYLGTKLEEVRYKEALDTPTLQVLDLATPPQIRSAPRRTLIVLVAAFVSLAVSTVLAFVCESLGRLSAENQEKIEAIRQVLRPRR